MSFVDDKPQGPIFFSQDGVWLLLSSSSSDVQRHICVSVSDHSAIKRRGDPSWQLSGAFLPAGMDSHSFCCKTFWRRLSCVPHPTAEDSPEMNLMTVPYRYYQHHPHHRILVKRSDSQTCARYRTCNLGMLGMPC